MTIELLTAALVLITAFYAWITFKILRSNEKVVEVMHEQAIAAWRPYVLVAPFREFGNTTIYLKISNSGRTAAKNLRLTIDKSFFISGRESLDLASFNAFNQSIDSFPPGAEIIFSLASSFQFFSGNTENPRLSYTFSVISEYEFADKKLREVNQIDLRPYLDTSIPEDAYLKKLRDINESLGMMAEHNEKLWDISESLKKIADHKCKIP